MVWRRKSWHFHSFWSLQCAQLQIRMVLVVLEIRSPGTSRCQRFHGQKLSAGIYLSRLCSWLKVLTYFCEISTFFATSFSKVGVFQCDRMDGNFRSIGSKIRRANNQTPWRLYFMAFPSFVFVEFGWCWTRARHCGRIYPSCQKLKSQTWFIPFIFWMVQSPFPTRFQE